MRGRVGILAHLPTQELERELERHEPLLGAVVEVALEASAFAVLGVDDARPRRLDGVELVADLGLEAVVLDREPDRGHRGRDEPRVVAERRVEVRWRAPAIRRWRWSPRRWSASSAGTSSGPPVDVQVGLGRASQR